MESSLATLNMVFVTYIVDFAVCFNQGLKMATKLGFDARNISMVHLTVEEFLLIEQYEANRLVDPRLRQGHLRGDITSQKQLIGAVALMPDGRRIRIDGNSRSAAWAKGTKEKPELVAVIVHRITGGMEEVDNLYDDYTSKGSSSTPSEQLYTAKIRVNFEPISDFWSKGSYKSIFPLLGYKNIEEGMMEFIPQLRISDSMDHRTPEEYSGYYKSVPVKAAILKSLKDDEANAVMFWSLFFSGDTSSQVINSARDSLESKAAIGLRGVPFNQQTFSSLTDHFSFYQRLSQQGN